MILALALGIKFAVCRVDFVAAGFFDFSAWFRGGSQIMIHMQFKLYFLIYDGAEGALRDTGVTSRRSREIGLLTQAGIVRHA